MKKHLEQEILDPDYEWGSDDSFEVEKILDQIKREGQKYYLIKWKGFDGAMNTWEHQDKLIHLPKLIEEFQGKKKGKNKNQSLREDESFLINPYRATQLHGHFLYGDTPKSIDQVIVRYDEQSGKKRIFLSVAWYPRYSPQDKRELQNSILDSNVVFQHNPEFLNDFYMKSLKLNEV